MSAREKIPITCDVTAPYLSPYVHLLSSSTCLASPPPHNSPWWMAWTAGCCHDFPAPDIQRTPRWSSGQTGCEGPPSWSPRLMRWGGKGWLKREVKECCRMLTLNLTMLRQVKPWLFWVHKRPAPRTRLRGSLMLTVWSWEAERELLMDLSAVRQQNKNAFCFILMSSSRTLVCTSFCFSLMKSFWLLE